MAALVQTEYLNIETPTSIDVVSSQHHSVNQSTYYFLPHPHQNVIDIKRYMTQLLLLGKFEYTRGPIFKVVLEC